MFRFFKKKNKLNEAEVMRNLADKKFVKDILSNVKASSEKGDAVVSIYLRRRSLPQTQRIIKILEEKGYSVAIKSESEKSSFGVIGEDWGKYDNYIVIWL